MYQNNQPVQIEKLPIDESLTLLIDPMPMVAGVSLGMWFPVGSGHEQAGEYGLTHFLEHMLFKGSSSRSAAEISRCIDRVGGYLNAFTERDALCLHCTVPAANFSLALDVLLDMVYDPVFTQADFEKELDIIRNEILSADDDIEEAAHDHFFATLFPAHSFGRKIAGTVEDLDTFSLADLEGFYRRKIWQGKKFLAIAGAVTVQDAISLLESKLKGLPRLRSESISTASFLPIASSVMLEQQKFQIAQPAIGSQIHFFSAIPLQKPADGWKSLDFWALSLASSAFGESMSSRLFMRLREDRGLCYNISSFVSFYQFAAHWGVNATTGPRQLPVFVEAYLAEAWTLYDNGLSDVEISEARTRMSGYLLLAADDVEYRMKRLARQFMFELNLSSIQEIQSFFSSDSYLCPETVNQYIRNFCQPSRASNLFFGKINHSTRKLVSGTKLTEKTWKTPK